MASKEERPITIAVVGASHFDPNSDEMAFATGVAIARRGATLVCGGGSGVMEAAARGARSSGGHTLGILPGYDLRAANPYIEFVIATGMGQARNAIVVASADAVIALAGEGGTLSEIGLALKLGRPVVALCSWPELAMIEHASDAEAAVQRACELARQTAARD